MKRIVCLFYLLFTLAGVSYAQSSRIEKVALDKVSMLPEVKSFMKTAKASKPALMIAGTPGKNSKYYWVKVGISDFDMFRTTYDFQVDPKTTEIFYLDMMVEEGPKVITLKLWRKWYHTRGFNQMHTFKAGNLVVINN
jgi:hypothetical protein